MSQKKLIVSNFKLYVPIIFNLYIDSFVHIIEYIKNILDCQQDTASELVYLIRRFTFSFGLIYIL